MKIGNVIFKSKRYLAVSTSGDNVDLFDDAAFYDSGKTKCATTDTLLNHPELLDKIISGEIKATINSVNEPFTTFLPCVLSPGKIICVGLNYSSHAKESNASLPDKPVLFSKFTDSLSGHNNEIKIPKEAHNVDYEAELGVVIGRKAFKVERSEALDYIFGYFPANDVSARDLQFIGGQWLLGKTLPGFAPIGPYITTSDGVRNPNTLDISLTLNDELRQSSNTRNMIFPVDYLIKYISNYLPLNPGDIILTGTPEGVIYGLPEEERIWLKHGDITEVSIEKLGSLKSKFI